MSHDVPPQLARQCFSVGSSSSDDDDDDSSEGSLEILLPARKEDSASSKFPASRRTMPQEQHNDVNKSSSKAHSVPALSSILTVGVDPAPTNDDDSSDDEILNQHRPTFARSNNSTTAQSLATVARKRPASSITTSSSSSFRAAMTASLLPNESKEEARARAKRETERRKQKEKMDRQQQREREQEERIRQKEADKQAKQRERVENQQASGKFSKQEVVVLLDPSMYRSNEYGIVSALQNEEFMVKACDISSMTFKKTIQWIRREYLKGGAENAWKGLKDCKPDQYELVSYLLVIMDYADYIPLIERIEHDPDDDYPKLGTWLETLKNQWKQAWHSSRNKQEPRVILLLNRVAEDLDRQWTGRPRNPQQNGGAGSSSLPTEWELRDSLQWLLVQFQVDAIDCTSHEEITLNVHKLTRGIAEAPYAAQATELECVRKIKPAANLGEDPFSRANDTWMRQLQAIPQVSELRARTLAQYYPTLQSLWQAYQEGDDARNPDLLNGCFGDRSSRASLSATIHKVMTCRDPKAMI